MKYKALLLSPLGAIPAGVQGAAAADIPLNATPTAFVHKTDWSGFYVGANAGLLSAQSQLNGYTPTSATFNYCWEDLANTACRGQSQTANGVLAGLQIGYNFQHGKWIYGFEADLGLSSAKANLSGGTYGFSIDTGVSVLSTARLRVGYTFDNSMVYATGGLALAKTRDQYMQSYFGTPYSWAKAGWRAGWTLGAGIEHMLTKNISIKGEGLYYDLGSTNLESTGTVGSTYAWGVRTKMDGFVARIGLNYHFH